MYTSVTTLVLLTLSLSVVFHNRSLNPEGGEKKPPKAKACCLLPSCGGLLAMFLPTLGLAAQLMKGFGIWVLGQNTH